MSQSDILRCLILVNKKFKCPMHRKKPRSSVDVEIKSMILSVKLDVTFADFLFFDRICENN